MSNRTSNWSHWDHNQQEPAQVTSLPISLTNNQLSSDPIRNNLDPITQRYSDQQQQNHTLNHQHSQHYHYASAPINSFTSNQKMSYHHQPRQPPSLNIAAAEAAAATAATTTSGNGGELSSNDQQQNHYSTNNNVSSHDSSQTTTGYHSASSYPGFNNNNAQQHHPHHHHQDQHYNLPSSNNNHASQTGHPVSYILNSPLSTTNSGYGGSSYSNNVNVPINGHSLSNNTHTSFHSAGYSGRYGNSEMTNFNQNPVNNQGQMHNSYDFHHQNGLQQTNHHLMNSHSFDGTGMFSMKSKRKQVKNACVNCQKACKRCDEGRPCSRCVKYGLTATCIDSARKERKRGIKRGPYKRRATTGSQPNSVWNNSGASSYMHTSSSMMLGGNGGGNGSGSNSSYGNPVHHSMTIHSAPPYSSSNSTHLAQQQQLRSGHEVEDEDSVQAMIANESFNEQNPHNSSYVVSGSAPSSIQRSTVPLGSLSYDTNQTASPSNSLTSMNVNGTRSSYTGRGGEYERSSPTSGVASSMYAVGGLNHTSNGQPASAPAASSMFHTNRTGVNASQSSISPPILNSSTSPFNNNGFLNAQNNPSNHHRLHSDSSLATLSANSSTTTANSSSMLSPRTPIGSNNPLGAGEYAVNGNNTSLSSSSSPGSGGMNPNQKYTGNNPASYTHHPISNNTTTSLTPLTTGAFLNPSNHSSNQSFSLHLPQAARLRGLSNSNPMSNGSSTLNNNTSFNEKIGGSNTNSDPRSRFNGSSNSHDDAYTHALSHHHNNIHAINENINDSTFEIDRASQYLPRKRLTASSPIVRPLL